MTKADGNTSPEIHNNFSCLVPEDGPVFPHLKLLNQIIGMSCEDAKELLKPEGLKLRVVQLCGASMVTTCDYIPHRINVSVDMTEDAEDTIIDIMSIG